MAKKRAPARAYKKIIMLKTLSHLQLDPSEWDWRKASLSSAQQVDLVILQHRQQPLHVHPVFPPLRFYFLVLILVVSTTDKYPSADKDLPR